MQNALDALDGSDFFGGQPAGAECLAAILHILAAVFFAGSAHAGLCGSGALDRQSIALEGTVETVDSWAGIWLITLAECSDLDIVLHQDPGCPFGGNLSVKGTYFYCIDDRLSFDGGYCRLHAVDDVTELSCRGPAILQAEK